VAHGGVSLVESSMNDRPAWWVGLSTVISCPFRGVGGGVEPGRRMVRGSLGTLLSPEASAVRRTSWPSLVGVVASFVGPGVWRRVLGWWAGFL
jgi:hypothetical protein